MNIRRIVLLVSLMAIPTNAYGSNWYHFCYIPIAPDSCSCSEITSSELSGSKDIAGPKVAAMCRAEYGEFARATGRNSNSMGQKRAWKAITSVHAKCACPQKMLDAMKGEATKRENTGSNKREVAGRTYGQPKQITEKNPTTLTTKTSALKLAEVRAQNQAKSGCRKEKFYGADLFETISNSCTEKKGWWSCKVVVNYVCYRK